MLNSKKEIEIRFSEVDSMGIVWHGNFIRFFEDGREDFGKKYGIGYMDVYREGFMIPIVEVHCSYKKPIRYETTIVVQTTFINSPASKITFDYTLYDKNSEEIYAAGRSVQVFLNKDSELHLTIPHFFEEWKRKWGIAD